MPTSVFAAGEYYSVKGNPFDSGVAVENASLYFIEKGKLTAFNSNVAARKVFAVEAHERFREFVMRPGFSCVGAKAAFHDEAYGFAVYHEMGTNDSTAGLCRDLCHFSQSGIMLRSEYSTFVAIFHSPLDLTETEFEDRLWLQLQNLHRASAKHFEWDRKVSSDPADPHFSFSFAGQAFYVIGLHPSSSRQARRFSWPALVFNPHAQFDRLRTDGKWKRMQKTIRAREIALQGSTNPMLSDFGEQSEARQYSGRAVSDDWTPPSADAGEKCPFAH